MGAYNKLYLQDAMVNMGEAIEAAVYVMNFSADDFIHMFVNSGISRQFEVANPKYICGKSGAELALEVYYRTYGTEYEIDSSDLNTDITPEYWCGWVLALYQWQTGRSFKQIQQVISMRDLIEKYHPYHEMDEMATIEYIDEKFENQKINRLALYRRALGLSQSQLSRESGVNLRTLQQYEIGAKDISKASVDKIISLSKALKCEVTDICCH